MSIHYMEGDLIKLAEAGVFDIIVHGCNCFCTMGSGIARQIKEQYPSAYAADLDTVKGDYNKLGTYTFTYSDCDKPDVSKFLIINAYTQYNFNSSGRKHDLFEYISFELILQKLAWEYPRARFGFPYIGMGLAGGNESKIVSLLEEFSRTIRKDAGVATLVAFR